MKQQGQKWNALVSRNIQFAVRRLWILRNWYLETIHVDSTILGSFSTLATSTLNTSIMTMMLRDQETKADEDGMENVKIAEDAKDAGPSLH